MPYLLFLCGKDLSKELRAIRQAADYFSKQGHRVGVITDAARAREALAEDAPHVLITTLFIPPNDAFHMTSALHRYHPGNQTGVVLLISAMGPNGEPPRYWPRVFHSYIMASGGRWQIILAVEQLLFLSVAGVTEFTSGERT